MDNAPNRFVLGVAYPADRVDGHGEFMTAEDVQRTAWQFMRDREAGLQHEDGTLGHIDVVESYIYRGPDWTQTAADGSTQIVRAGDWLLGGIFDPATFEAVLSGQFTGWSIQGLAARKTNQEP